VLEWCVVAAGVLTIALVITGRALPFAVGTGAITGLITGQRLLEVIDNAFVFDASQQPEVGLLIKMAGGALAGATGVAGLLVARERDKTHSAHE
jgi:hypothetical protein